MPFVKADPWHGTRQLQVISKADGRNYLVDAETQEVIKDIACIEIICNAREGLYAKIEINIDDPAHIFPSGPIVDGQLVNQHMIEAEKTV